ncbi:MAG TPA: hypothetical protein VKC54_00875 [Patescibacteria group bacterium]|nr:hypothetical protein [Patescibacteria group bacterium]
MKSEIEGNASQADIEKHKSKHYSALTRWLNKKAGLGYEAYEVEDVFGKHIQVVENKFPVPKIVGYLHIDPQTLKMKLFERTADGVMKQIKDPTK